MSVTLNTVGTALGKVGSVTLAGAVENGYARTHAASGYLRVNPFEVGDGQAPSEFVAPHTLGDWASYTQAAMNTGSDLEVTVGYAELEVTWVLPTGYSLATAILTQKLMIRSMGGSEVLSTDPFDTPFSTTDVADVVTFTVAATVGEFFAIGVKSYFDDSVTVHEVSSSNAYVYKTGETPLTGAGAGVSSEAAVYDTSPTISSVVQDTDPGACLAGCTGCVDITVNVTMEGTSAATVQEKVASGSWVTIDTGLPAGSSSFARTSLDAGVLYEYRLKYNAVSPETWSTTGSITTECTLV